MHRARGSSIISSAPIYFLLALGLSIFMCFWNLGEASFKFHHDERTHILVTQEMLHTGNLLEPRYYDKPYLNKPPLKMWLSLGPLYLLGESNFSYRSLDALGGVITALVTFFLVLRLFGSPQTALLAVVMLLATRTFLFERIARHAVQDSFLVMFCSLAMLSAWEMQRLLLDWRAERRSQFWTWSVGFGLATAGAVMSKSAAGAHPLVFILILWFLSGTWRVVLENAKLPVLIGFGLALSLPGTWFLYCLLKYPELAAQNWQGEIFDRLSQGYHNRNKPWFYLQRLFFRRDGPPALLLGLGAAYSTINAFRFKNSAHLFLFVWGVLPIAIYSAMSSRCIHYLGPVFPVLAILSAQVLMTLAQELKSSLGRRAWLSVLVLGVLVFGGSYQTAKYFSRLARAVNKPGQAIAIDKLVRQSKACAESGHDKCHIAVIGSLYLAEREQTYLKMLPGKLSPLWELDPSLAKQAGVLIFNDQDGLAFLKLNPNYRSRVLPPIDERKEALVLVCLGDFGCN